MFKIKNIAFELSFLRIDGIRVRKGLKREQGLRGHNFRPLKTAFALQGRLQGSSVFRILSFVECFWRFSVFFFLCNSPIDGPLAHPFPSFKGAFLLFFPHFRLMSLPPSIDFSKFHIFTISDSLNFFVLEKKLPEFSSDGYWLTQIRK